MGQTPSKEKAYFDEIQRFHEVIQHCGDVSMLAVLKKIQYDMRMYWELKILFERTRNIENFLNLEKKWKDLQPQLFYFISLFYKNNKDTYVVREFYNFVDIQYYILDELSKIYAITDPVSCRSTVLK